MDEVDKEIKEKEVLVKMAEDIKEKRDALIRIKDQTKQVARQHLEPVMETLSELEVEQQLQKKRKREQAGTSTFTSTQSSPSQQQQQSRQAVRLSTILKELKIPSLENPHYGLKYDSNAHCFYMGDLNVSITENDIRVQKHHFPRTQGLMHLLTRTTIDSCEITDEDKAHYAQLLELTKAHRRSDGHLKYVVNSPIYQLIKDLVSSSSTEKKKDSAAARFGKSKGSKSQVGTSPRALNFGKDAAETDVEEFSDALNDAAVGNPFFFGNNTTATATSTPNPLQPSPSPFSGQGIAGVKQLVGGQKRKCKQKGTTTFVKKLGRNWMKQCNLPYQMVYYDDVNELVERLHLLHGERLSGNFSVQAQNEMESIIEELKELKVIS